MLPSVPSLLLTGKGCQFTSIQTVDSDKLCAGGGGGTDETEPHPRACAPPPDLQPQLLPPPVLLKPLQLKTVMLSEACVSFASRNPRMLDLKNFRFAKW